jgi:hypothetical protein
VPARVQSALLGEELRLLPGFLKEYGAGIGMAANYTSRDICMVLHQLMRALVDGGWEVYNAFPELRTKGSFQAPKQAQSTTRWGEKI